MIHSPPVASAPEETEAFFSPRMPDPERAPRMPRGGPNVPPRPPWAPGIPPRQEFGGDLAVSALRRRLALEPDAVPEPPLVVTRERALPWMTRLGFIFLVAGVVAFGITFATSSDFFMTFVSKQSAPAKGDRIRLATNNPAVIASSPVHDPAKLLVEGRQAPANEPLLLGVSLQGASGNEIVLLNGLKPGTRLTAGAPVGALGWRLAAGDLGSVFAYAPRDYIGAMEAAIDLRSPGDRLLDSQIVRLEWVPKEPEPALRPSVPVHRLDSEEIAQLMKRGQQFLQTGDVASARLMFRRAAEDGNAAAALALGATYDPSVLREIGVLGFAPSTAQAREWYQKAADLGSTEAARRMERLPATR
jgi:hypothetical protein